MLCFWPVCQSVSTSVRQSIFCVCLSNRSTEFRETLNLLRTLCVDVHISRNFLFIFFPGGYAPFQHRNLTKIEYTVSATPLKPLNRISWNFVVMKDTLCRWAYSQDINILLKRFVIAAPLKPLNRISWNSVNGEDIVCRCAYSNGNSDSNFFLREQLELCQNILSLVACVKQVKH